MQFLPKCTKQVDQLKLTELFQSMWSEGRIQWHLMEPAHLRLEEERQSPFCDTYSGAFLLTVDGKILDCDPLNVFFPPHHREHGLLLGSLCGLRAWCDDTILATQQLQERSQEQHSDVASMLPSLIWPRPSIRSEDIVYGGFCRSFAVLASLSGLFYRSTVASYWKHSLMEASLSFLPVSKWTKKDCVLVRTFFSMAFFTMQTDATSNCQDGMHIKHRTGGRLFMNKPQSTFYKDAPFTKLQEKTCGLSALPWRPNSTAANRSWRRRRHSFPERPWSCRMRTPRRRRSSGCEQF